jgi:hypothetical protein
MNVGVIMLFFLIIHTNFIYCDYAKIDITDTIKIIGTFYPLFKNESLDKDEYELDDVLNLSGKICNFNEIEEIKEYCFKKFENFNYDWVMIKC